MSRKGNLPAKTQLPRSPLRRTLVPWSPLENLQIPVTVGIGAVVALGTHYGPFRGGRKQFTLLTGQRSCS